MSNAVGATDEVPLAMAAPELSAGLLVAFLGDRLAAIVSTLDRLSRNMHFISVLMAHKVPFVVTELGSDVDPFVSHDLTPGR
jgi:hypothetical protein